MHLRGRLLRRAVRLALVAGGTAAAAVVAIAPCYASAAAAPPSSSPVPPSKSGISHGLLGAIGHTPLIEIPSLSAATGCRILVKAEHLNPMGSVKDRPAAAIIAAAEAEGRLVPRERRRPGDIPGTIVEGTGGNTGIALATLAAARGYACILTMPSNVSDEKVALARTLGATVVVCPPVAFSSEHHYYNVAQRLAAETPGGVWGNQFEGLANSQAHFASTGPEIWAQSGGDVDALVLAAGTGGTIGGLGAFFKARNPGTLVYLIDPPGSSLAEFIDNGVVKPSPGTTITEGIGIGRLTANFARAHAAGVDGALRGRDQEAVEMAWYLLRREGLFLGPSAALNVCGAVKVARMLGPGHTVVTIACDGGGRYGSKMYSQPWLEEQGFKLAANWDTDNADFVA